MSNVFVRELNGNGGEPRPTLIFCAYNLEISSNREELKSRFYRTVVERWVGPVWLLVPETLKAGAVDAVQSILPNAWPEPLRDTTHQYVVFTFDSTGAITQASGPIVSPDWTAVRQELLRGLLDSRHGVLPATPAHHFEKPNRRHSAVLIRAANLLVDEAEISLIAMFLLPLAGRECREIWMDSASLFPLGYSLSQLRRVVDPQASDLRISSFQSHYGLSESLRIASRGKKSLWVISASATGGLAKRIRADGRAGIVTLFQDVSGGTEPGILCPIQLTGLAGTRQSECTLCGNHSVALSFEPDLFVPIRPAVSSHLPSVDTLPAGKAAALIKDLGIASSILIHFTDPSSTGAATGAHEIWIDAKSFATRHPLDAWLRSRLPIGLGGITYLDDLASEHMAHAAHQHMPHVEKPRPATEASQLDPTRPVAVMASVLVDGRRLSAVAQRLREHKDKGGVSWFIDFCRVPTAEQFSQIRNALTQGSKGTDLFHVRHPTLELPDRRTGAWDLEKELLDGSAALLTRLRVRSEQLHAGGLTDDALFLPDLRGNPLRLRENSFLGEKGSSQAAIFLRVSHWLHFLRTRRTPALYSGYLSWTVLEPHLFDRFNDGVIQAAVLRAALPRELNYSAAPEACAAMLNKLENVFANAGEDQGEACLEFLMALATRRLIVGDLGRLFDKASIRNAVKDPTTKTLLDLARERAAEA